MGHFATGVTIVTSLGADGRPVGTTASAVTSLSLDPPLVLVCLDLGSLTLQAIRGHRSFAVNVLGAAQRHLSANFARRGLTAAWDGVRHRHGPTGSPRLEDVLAVVECTVAHLLPGGDHEIVIGRVRPPRPARAGGAAGILPRGLHVVGFVRPARRGSAGSPRRPAGDRGVQLGELGLGDVQAAGGNRRAQLDQDRPQVHLDREGMTGPPPVMTGTAIVPARPLLP